jgi:hypothetical protein
VRSIGRYAEITIPASGKKACLATALCELGIAWMEVLNASVVNPFYHDALYHRLVDFKAELFKFLYVASNYFLTYHRMMQCYVPKLELVKAKYWNFK